MKEFVEFGKELFKPSCIATAPILLIFGCIVGATKGGLLGALIGALFGCVAAPLLVLVAMILTAWFMWIMDRFE